MFLAILTFSSPMVANASIIGLYFPSQGEQVSILMKAGKPVLRIEIPSHPDVPECNGSFQTYREKPYSGKLKLVDGPRGTGTGFALWESRGCLEAGHWAKDKPARKKHIQEIDIYKDFFGHFDNKNEIIGKFERGEIFLALMYQSGFPESTRKEVFYTFKEAQKGKVLIAPN